MSAVLMQVGGDESEGMDTSTVGRAAVALNEENILPMLKIYYSRLFPYKHMFQWLSYCSSDDDITFRNREVSMKKRSTKVCESKRGEHTSCGTLMRLNWFTLSLLWFFLLSSLSHFSSVSPTRTISIPVGTLFEMQIP
jgi:hypothetical protein